MKPTQNEWSDNPTHLERRWKALCGEIGREGGNARLIAIAVLGGLLSLAILLPFIMT